VTCRFVSAVQTALQVCLFDQWNDVHASSPLNSLFLSWENV